MKPFKIDHQRPFACNLEGSGGLWEVFVHFGVVICPSTNSLNNLFIPEMPLGPMKRGGEKDADRNNKISVSGKGVICLDIEVKSDDLFLDPLKNQEWQDAVNGINLINYLETNFSKQDRGNYLSENTIDILKTVFFSPLVPITPQILRASIRFVPIDGAFLEAESEDEFNFLVDNHKLIAIATVDTSIPRLEQILETDYIFNFPFYYKADTLTGGATLKEDFQE